MRTTTRRPRPGLGALLAAAISTTTLSAQHEVEQYSWPFRNFRSTSEHVGVVQPGSLCPDFIDDYDWSLFRRTFFGVPPEENQHAGEWLFFEQVYRTELGRVGNCYGISLMSLLIHEKGGHAGFCGPTLQYSGDLDKRHCRWSTFKTAHGPTDLRLREAIEVLHGYQASYPSLLFYADLLSRNATRNGMFAWQRASELAPVLVSITENLNPANGGHTMLAYAAEVDRGDPNLHYIYYYDPNYSWADPDFQPFYENRHNRITVRADDLSWSVTRDWRFDEGLGDVVPTATSRVWSGSPSRGGHLVIIPLDVVAHKARSAGSDAASVLHFARTMFISGDADLAQVSSDDGKRLFRPGTFEIDTGEETGMLSVVPLYLSDGGGSRLETSTYTFLDGSPGPFEIEIAPGPSGYSMTIGGARGAVEVRAHGARFTDAVLVDGANTTAPRLTLLNRGGAESYDVSFTQHVKPGERSRVFRARNIVLPPGVPLRLGLSQNRGGLQVESPVADVELDVVLERRAGDDLVELEVERVSVAAGESTFLAPRSWTELTGSPLNLYATEIPAEELEELLDRVHIPAHRDVGPDFDAARNIGESVSGSIVYSDDSETYVQDSGPGAIGAAGDSLHLAYRRVAGDFELIAELLPAAVENPQARHGLMARRDATASSRYSFLELREGSYRTLHGEAGPVRSWQGPVNAATGTRFLKLVRRGSTMSGFVSTDGETWQPMGADTWTDLDAETALLVGFASTAGDSDDASVEFRVVRFGGIEPALAEPIADDNSSEGELVHAYRFDGGGVAGSGWTTNVGEGAFRPLVTDGLLRLLDAGAVESSTSAFAQRPLEDIDDAVWQFDFDVLLDAVDATGGGVVFTLMAGLATERVGFDGADLGYRGVGVGGEDGSNVLTNSIAVEIDLGEPPSAAADEAGAPHVAIDVQGSISPVAENRDALIGELLDDGGLHVRVLYNRGRVDVLVGALDGDEPMRPMLTALALPLGFSSGASSAVFGFTAGSSSAGFTAEVDDVEVRGIDCDDVEEIAIVEDLPAAPVAVGDIVHLDGSASHGGPGEEEQEVFHLWEVIAGAAEIIGPDHGPTVRLEAKGEGAVTVRLTVDDLDCDNPGTVEVEFLVGGGIVEEFLRADANRDGEHDISDAVFTLLYLFAGGPAPGCEKSADADDSGVVEITDVIFTLDHLFKGGRTPPMPYPECGEDPTEDGLSCEDAAVCE